MVLVGGQADRAGLDPQRNVLAHQRHSLAFGGEVGGARQDPGVVGAGAEAARQNRGIGVIEFDVQRPALRPNGNRLIQSTVLETQIVEQPQRLAGEPAQFVVMPFGFEFADDDQRNDHLVFGEPRTRPRVGEQD